MADVYLLDRVTGVRNCVSTGWHNHVAGKSTCELGRIPPIAMSLNEVASVPASFVPDTVSKVAPRRGRMLTSRGRGWPPRLPVCPTSRGSRGPVAVVAPVSREVTGRGDWLVAIRRCIAIDRRLLQSGKGRTRSVHPRRSRSNSNVSADWRRLQNSRRFIAHPGIIKRPTPLTVFYRIAQDSL